MRDCDKMLASMRQTRRLIQRAYDQELCDHVEARDREQIMASARSLKCDVDRLLGWVLADVKPLPVSQPKSRPTV